MVMRGIKLLLFVVIISAKVTAQPYQATIYIPEPRQDVSDAAMAVQDMVYWLHRATDKVYEVTTTAAAPHTGIRLQWADQADLPAAVQQQLQADGQSFYLSVDGDRSATIVGTGPNSFSNGIYTFLYELGFRWYMSGDAWTIVPDLQTAQKLKINKAYTPSFRNRSYFGTGGTRGIPEFDPQNTFRSDFEAWNRRNRYSQDFTTQGHAGGAFYRQNKKYLDQHPEYFCNQEVNRKGWLDISNREAVDYFVEWALSRVDRSDPYPVIGVEPADGSGGKDDCLPQNMPQIKNWSDKYFWLANQVAEAAEEKAPHAVVQLIAYASHAAPPHFELHRQVYPYVIPYAYQRVTAPQQLIAMWRKKLKDRPMGLYDYWNITSSSIDVPRFNIYSIPEKLKLWHQNKVSSIKLESTLAKGPMGHALWLAGQMMWDVSQDFETLYNQFLNDCFGPAAPDIRRMYDRWSKNYQGNMEWVFSKKDLDHAATRTKDPAILKRIDELGAYVQYLRLLSDYQQYPTQKGYGELVQYLQDIHPMRLLQTSALLRRYIKKPGDVKTKSSTVSERLADAFDSEEGEDNAPDNAENSQLPYSVSHFNFDIRNATLLPGGKTHQPDNIIGPNSYQFVLPHARRLTFQAGTTKQAQFSIVDSAGMVRFSKIIAAGETNQTLNVSLPAGSYSVRFGTTGGKGRLILPADIPFFTSSKYYSNGGYPLLYVYVPRDVAEIVYRDVKGPGVNKRGNWINPEGKTIQPTRIKYDVYRVPVPPAQRGKVWVLNIGYRGFEMLNIPGVFSLNPFLYQE